MGRPVKQPRIRRVPLAVVDYEKLLAIWGTDALNEDICTTLGVSAYVLDRIKRDLRLPRRSSRKPWHNPGKGKRNRDPEPELDPEEVQHRVAKVQARWTDEMFVLRSIGRVRPLPYHFPVYALGRLR